MLPDLKKNSRLFTTKLLMHKPSAPCFRQGTRYQQQQQTANFNFQIGKHYEVVLKIHLGSCRTLGNMFLCALKYLPKICENRTWYSVHPALHPAPIKTRALPDRTTILYYYPKKKSDFREWIDALRVIDTKNKSEELQEISCLKKWLKPIYILHLTSSLSRRHPALEESFIFLTKQIKDSDTYKLHIMFQSLQSQTVHHKSVYKR